MTSGASAVDAPERATCYPRKSSLARVPDAMTEQETTEAWSIIDKTGEDDDCRC